MTSIKKRSDYVLNQISNIDTEPSQKALGSVVAELSIIKGAFKESDRFPVCCFTDDACSRIVYDVNG